MRVLFWNTYKKKVNSILLQIIQDYDADLIVLAEYADDLRQLLAILAINNIPMKQYLTAGCEKIIMLGSINNVQAGTQANRYSIQIINNQYILCGMHLPCQLYDGHERIREIVIRNVLQDIQSHEESLHSRKTILVGDLNEDPYDAGCLDAMNFHGIPDRTVAKKGSRVIQSQTFQMFYNPMWNFFGDFTEPKGTCYFPESKPKNSFWHIFDQVMIRPDLIDSFHNDKLKIITSIRGQTLLDNYGHPNKDISDHLPIFFEIKEE